MTDLLAHRGPDAEADWINDDGTVGFGHRRLAIIDLSVNAAQPMHCLNRYTIVYNGEIYNYIEIRQILSTKGYTFTSASDTEVILAAYDCWKENCLQHFDGMFALAIWDEKEKLLFAARDRLGEKPFHYGFHNDALLFASEIKALWAAGMKKKVNEPLLYNFITLGYTQNPHDPAETAYQKIYKLPAGYFFYYTIDERSIQPKQYWSVDPSIDNSVTTGEATRQFTALFNQSVEKRLRSDVPLGTSLSGGLDSSSIAATICRLQPQVDLQTFSAVFPGTAADESAYIQLLAKENNIGNFTVAPSADDFIKDFEKLCFHQEGLITSASVYAQYKVFELAKEHGVKVLLDGQGADEILAGYHKYYHWYWQQLYREDRPLLQQEMVAARALDIAEEWNWKNKLSAVWPRYATKYLTRQRAKTQLATAGLNGEFSRAFGTSYYHLPQPDSLNNVLRYNTFQNGLEEMLQYADRNSMAHGREVRLPFLQHELVQFIFSLPASYKIRAGRTKWLLRKSMENILPAAITWRKDKIGFEPPQKKWMQQPVVQEYIREGKNKLVQQNILDKMVLTKKIQPLDAHAADNFDWRYLVASQLF